MHDPASLEQAKASAGMNEALIRLQGQVALVTGASRGIGRAIALALARSRAARVIGTATTASRRRGDRRNALAAHPGCQGIVLDVTDGAALDAAIDAVAKDAGRPASLVNNAGITRDKLSMRMKDEEWDAVIDTNLKSVFRLSRAVMRGDDEGSATAASSTSPRWSERSATPGQANYAAAKAGVAGLSRALAREIGSRNITVNCVAPGFIDTDMTDGADRAQPRGAAGADPARPAGHGRRCRRGGGVPGLAAGRLHHRHDAACQRRHVHGLNW